MTLLLGDIAPNFTAETTEGPVEFYSWLGDSWGLLFSHPADFTPVCTTELGRTASLKGEFEKRNVKVIALSIDPLASHELWLKDIEETQGIEVNFPVIADENRVVASMYGMIHPNETEISTVRTVFVIDPERKVRLTLTYPLSTGRNFLEILRVIDSLQLTSYHQVATPADWQQGDDVYISPDVQEEELPRLFPKGHQTLKPYLRVTPQPNMDI